LALNIRQTAPSHDFCHRRPCRPWQNALLTALTGQNADRLPEEKKRGMTIDLGYVYLPLADGRVAGFIDVPGHEKFLANMLWACPAFRMPC
jgi:selenocysteine-specific translation elongation factor